MSHHVNLTEVKTLLPGDKGFKFTKNMIEYPRAAILVTEDCPSDIKTKIWLYQRQGYIRPVAHVPTKELVWEELQR